MLLNVVLTRGLPGVISVGEEDGLGADGAGNALDGDLLLGNTGDGLAVGVTGVGPASLEVEDVLATDLLEDLVLAQSEGTSLSGGGVGVEEGVDVGTDQVDGRAQAGGTILLPDVNGLGGGNLASVTGRLEGRLGGRDEAGKLSGSDVSAGDGLVTDNDQLNHAPLSPLGNSLDLLLSTGGTSGLDVDTEDNVHAVLLGSVADELQTAAISRVDTEKVEALVGNNLDVLGDLLLGHAVTAVGVGRESHAVLAGTGEAGAAAAAGGGSAGRNSRGSGSSDGGGSGSRGRDGRGGCQASASGVGAVVGGISLSHGDGGLGLSVGAGGDGGSGGDNHGGVAGNDSGGTGDNGVGAGHGASVGGVLNDAGHGGTSGLDSGVGAGHNSAGGDNGGDFANSVGTAGESGGGGTADSGGVGDGHGGGRNGVGTSGGEAGDTVGGQSHVDGGNRGSVSRGGRSSRGRSGGSSHGGSHGHRAGESAGGVDSAGEGAGRLNLSGGSHAGRSLAGGSLSGGGLGNGDQSGRAVVGDDLGGAATSLLTSGDQRSNSRGRGRGRSRARDGDGALLVKSIMTTVEVTVSQSGAHNGGGGEDGALHFE